MDPNSILVAEVTTYPQITAELVRPVVAALEDMHRDAVVSTNRLGPDHVPRWLLPTAVSVLFRPHLLTVQLLQQLGAASNPPITAALVDVYAEIDAIRRTALLPGGLRPLSLEFHKPPRELSRFVLGIGLRGADVSRALEGLPRTLHGATARLQRSKDLFRRVADMEGESGVSLSNESSYELNHLYEDPAHGWEIIT
jgi:hypothetical protein